MDDVLFRLIWRAREAGPCVGTNTAHLCTRLCLGYEHATHTAHTQPTRPGQGPVQTAVQRSVRTSGQAPWNGLADVTDSRLGRERPTSTRVWGGGVAMRGLVGWGGVVEAGWALVCSLWQQVRHCTTAQRADRLKAQSQG
eukprot:CAMPEP_0183331890 /NCGR_PEP_ID=MMETSP0164_2-20130417/1199_1 /TAXON_ID=221442 /ORGANISM="Coccolithus pelagicus ssp braarudi, Strain PLY182g" /LENGTH=139 /DNA_ID=CAMNT_0025500493 /DNA_START=96 /DNA_END=515 /DNA_ORIENTATION=-